jgi:isoleucyl-tRNA synthetase
MTNRPKQQYPDANQNIDLAKIEKEILKFWQDNQIFEQSIAIRSNQGKIQELENYDEDNTSPVINNCSLNDHRHCRHEEVDSDNNNFVFYDGPPFANGLPHYGHLLTGFIKDIFARYQTMKGKKVDRRFGWDTHGLPVEMETEKELTKQENRAISGQIAIQEYGIDKFNQACRQSVMKYADKWEEYVTRQGRFVDFRNSYKTMDLSYMESVIWAFKELYNKGLIYEKLRVVPYSWACQTPLSNFETRMDNAYRQKESKAITVKFNLKNIENIIQEINHSKRITNESNNTEYNNKSAMIFVAEELLKYCDRINRINILVWTTTPWTLPSNLALAINRDIEYSLIIKNPDQINNQENIEALIIAKNLISKYPKELENYLELSVFKGSLLLGLNYRPIMPYLTDHSKLINCKNAFTILHGDFVSINDGTGIVHIAPAFGEEDQALCEIYNIPTICPVDEAGKFTSQIYDIY